MTVLHHVQVTCPPGGEDEDRRFYGELLGLAEVEKPPALAARGGVWFRGEGYELHIGVEDPFVAATRAHPASWCQTWTGWLPGSPRAAPR